MLSVCNIVYKAEVVVKHSELATQYIQNYPDLPYQLVAR